MVVVGADSSEGEGNSNGNNDNNNIPPGWEEFLSDGGGMHLRRNRW